MSRKIVLVIWGLLSFFFVQADESRARWITAFENQSASNTWLCFRKDTFEFSSLGKCNIENRGRQQVLDVDKR